MKSYLDSAHVLYGFTQERAIEWAQDYLSAPAARERVLAILKVLSQKSSEPDQRRLWRLTNDGAIVYAREQTILSLRPDVSFMGSAGVMLAGVQELGTCTIYFSAPDVSEMAGNVQAKFHFTIAELRPIFKAFDKSAIIHVLYDERALLDATRLDRIEAAFEAFVMTA